MRIRKATGSDAQAIKELYFEHLTSYPPEEEQSALETVIHQCEQWADVDTTNYELY